MGHSLVSFSTLTLKIEVVGSFLEQMFLPVPGSHHCSSWKIEVVGKPSCHSLGGYQAIST